MPTLVHMVARFASATGLPQDSTENVFNVLYDPGPPSGAQIDACLTAVENFYNQAGAGGSADLGDYIGQSISRSANAHLILAYTTTDLTGATPLGSPVDQLAFTLGSPAGTTSLPEEVAAVLSVHADLTDVPVSQVNPTPPPATIRPAQRRHGRLFIGPLQNNAGSDQGSFYLPSNQFITDVLAAYQDLNVDVIAAGGQLVVWSKADGEAYPIIGGWLDNAWDTQRRRGIAPTARNAFLFP